MTPKSEPKPPEGALIPPMPKIRVNIKLKCGKKISVDGESNGELLGGHQVPKFRYNSLKNDEKKCVVFLFRLLYFLFFFFKIKYNMLTL